MLAAERAATTVGLIMRSLKSLLLASAAGLLAVSAAAAADLPTKKTPPAAAKPNCYASFWTWLDSTAADCPLSAYGITVYGTIDMGGGYETHASRFNDRFNNGVSELVAKTSGNARWQLAPNGLSQSNIGIKIKEQLAPDWFVIGDVNTGFDPYTFRLANGPGSLVDNNGLTGTAQSANGDSSRAGQWDNTRAYAGLSNKTFGTLTVGRQYAFSNDLANNYDPTGGSYGFSLIGSSGTPVAGLGDTEMARYNTSVKYQVQYQMVRAGAVYEFGNYSWGNGANGAYQFDLGGDYAGFSVDAIYSHANDAVFLGVAVGGPDRRSAGYLLGRPQGDDRQRRQLGDRRQVQDWPVPGVRRLRLRPVLQPDRLLRRQRRRQWLHRHRRLRRARQFANPERSASPPTRPATRSCRPRGSARSTAFSATSISPAATMSSGRTTTAAAACPGASNRLAPAICERSAASSIGARSSASTSIPA